MRKALLIGINTYSPQKPLRGCITDAAEMSSLLVDVFNYESVQVLPEQGLTKASLLQAISDLFAPVAGEVDGARLFFFAGHGGRVFDIATNGDEIDRIDENLCLASYVSSNAETYLLDDEFAEILADAATAAPSVRRYVVLDSCHSGTATRADTRTWLDAEKDLFDTFQIQGTDGLGWQFDDPRLALLAVARQADDPPELVDLMDRAADPSVIPSTGFARASNSEPTTHLLLSGCSAQQTCKDVPLEGSHHGIFTFTLTRLARGNPNLTWQSLRDAIVPLIEPTFQQTPQLEGPPEMKGIPIFL